MKIVTTREDPGQINNLADVSDQPADGTSVCTGAVPGATLSRALPRLCEKKELQRPQLDEICLFVHSQFPKFVHF